MWDLFSIFFLVKKKVRKSVFKKKNFVGNIYSIHLFPSSLMKHDIIITCLVWTLLYMANLISTKWLSKYNSRHCFAMIYMRRTIRLFRLIHPIRLNFTAKHLQENPEDKMFSFKVQIASKKFWFNRSQKYSEKLLVTFIRKEGSTVN